MVFIVSNAPVRITVDNTKQVDKFQFFKQCKHATFTLSYLNSAPFRQSPPNKKTTQQGGLFVYRTELFDVKKVDARSYRHLIRQPVRLTPSVCGTLQKLRLTRQARFLQTTAHTAPSLYLPQAALRLAAPKGKAFGGGGTGDPSSTL